MGLPGFQSVCTSAPNMYCLIWSGAVSAAQTLPAGASMWMEALAMWSRMGAPGSPDAARMALATDVFRELGRRFLIAGFDGWSSLTKEDWKLGSHAIHGAFLPLLPAAALGLPAEPKGGRGRQAERAARMAALERRALQGSKRSFERAYRKYALGRERRWMRSDAECPPCEPPTRGFSVRCSTS